MSDSKHPKNYDATLARMVGNLLSGKNWCKGAMGSLTPDQKQLVREAIAVSEYALDHIKGSNDKRRA